MENSFRMPAEWESHSAIWLAWPHDTITFGSLNEQDKKLDEGRLVRVESKYMEMIKAIYETEKVKLLVLNQKMKDKVEKLLQNAGIDTAKIVFIITEYADVWIRDYGPTFVKNVAGEIAGVKWKYFSYGGKFPTLIKDNEVFLNLSHGVDWDMFQADIFMEGGAIEVNGKGVVLTTEECLLNSNRNPELNKEQTETHLKENLGASKVIWLKKGLENDHTDGHIDDIAKFVDANTILCAFEDDKLNPNFASLNENYQILQNNTDQDGQPFNLVKLPMPHMNYTDGMQAPVSYANFYIGNKTVLVPVYQDPNDEKALEIIKSHFPDRKIVGIDCRDIIYGGGAIHCITQQEPI